MELKDARPGMNVRYIPGVAKGDPSHPACEDGIVSSRNDKYVFVKFKITQPFGQACDPNDLIKVQEWDEE